MRILPPARWPAGPVAVALLFVAGCINFIDRSTVSVALPAIRHDLHLSDAQSGLLLSAFAWSYAVAQLPAGSLVDRLGVRAALAGGLVLWSAVQGLTALVRGLPVFIAARVSLGLGESPMFVGGARVCADRFPPEKRALPLGLLNASASFGPAIAPLVLTPLMVAVGWRASFAVLGAAGLLIAAAWWLLYRNPAAPSASDGGTSGGSPNDTVATTAPNCARAAGSESEADPCANTPDTGVQRIAGPRQWLALIRQRAVCGLLLGFAGTVYMTWLYVTWLPDYLLARWHMTEAHAALWSALPQFAGFRGSISGGWLSDRLAAVMNGRAARQVPLAAGLYAAAACSALATLAGDAALAIGLIAAALFSANLATTSGWALAAALAPPALIATVEAMANIGGSVGGSLAPLITGALVQSTGAFSAALLVAGLVAAACAAANQILTRQPIVADSG